MTLTSTDGTDFSTVTAVTIGGVSQIIVSQTATTLTLLIMPGTTGGTIVFTTSSGSINAGTASFTVSGGSPPATQQGSKLVGTGNTGAARQGVSGSLSADGNTALIGGWQDNSNQGAAWVFVP